MAKDVIIKSTHRGLRYEDGRLTEVLEAGRYELPERRQGPLGWRRPVVEIVMVDMRERELTIRGQEILTADKVAIRVSILTQFQVTDPVAAVEKVVSYEDRLYSDVQRRREGPDLFRQPASDHEPCADGGAAQSGPAGRGPY
jgi:regulator of protease activity HflC (stomatin/prohibitin superfamily)